MLNYLEKANNNEGIKKILFKRSPDLRLVSCINKHDYTHIGLFRKVQNKKYKLINIVDEAVLDDEFCMKKYEVLLPEAYFKLYTSFIWNLKNKEFSLKIKNSLINKTYIETFDVEDIIINDIKFNRKNILTSRRLLAKDDSISLEDFKKCINEIKIILIEKEFQSYIEKILNIKNCDVIIHIKEFNYITQIKL